MTFYFNVSTKDTERNSSPFFICFYILLRYSFFAIILIFCIGKVSAEPHKPTYKHLLLLYPSTDVVYEKDGIEKQFKGTLTDEHKQVLIGAFQNLPKLIDDGSNSFVDSMVEIIERPDPIRHITKFSGNYYWLSEADPESVLLTLHVRHKALI